MLVENFPFPYVINGAQSLRNSRIGATIKLRARPTTNQSQPRL